MQRVTISNGGDVARLQRSLHGTELIDLFEGAADVAFAGGSDHASSTKLNCYVCPRDLPRS